MSIKVVSRATGKLQEYATPAEASAAVAQSNGELSIPDAAEVERLERVAQHGDTGSQALAAVEVVGRTASFGAWKGFGSEQEIEARRQTLREESPGTAFAAEAAGATLPAIAGGAAVSGAAGALGAGARLAGAAGVAAEGATGGLASEVESAGAQGRPVSPGLAMLTGIGGEVLGRALPAVVRAGVSRVSRATDAGSVVLGEAVPDVSGAAGKRARAKLAEDAYHMPPGPDRDRALAQTAADQLERADGILRSSATSALAQLEKLGKVAYADLERAVPRTTPGQVRWAAETAGELRRMAEAAPEARRAELLDAARELVEAEDAAGIWRAAARARERFRAAPPDAPPAPAAAPQQAANGSPVSLEGLSLKDLRALELDGAAVNGGKSDAQRVADLVADPEFARTGRVSSNDGRRGIVVVDDGDGLVLRDGRHRLQAARDLDRDTVWGQVVDGKSGDVLFEGELPLKGPARGIRRNAAGARRLSNQPGPDSPPDFADWDVADFARGKGAGKAAGKAGADYSGGARISQYQRSIVDGLKQNSEFSATGRISGDAGKLGSEPTFALQPDGTVKLDHGRLRITAARELGRETVFGRVVRGKGKSQQIVYEGQIRVAAPGRAQPSQPGPAPANPFAAADDLLARGQSDQALFGRAAEAASDLEGSAAGRAAGGDPLDTLEAQLQAAQRWQIGDAKAREALTGELHRMRAAQQLKDDTERAVAAVGATGKAPGKRAPKPEAGLGAQLLQEGAEFALERALGSSLPGAGFVARRLWGALGDSGKAAISRTVRGMLSPVTSNGRVLGASRSGAAMTALQLFAGDAPDARSAYESRRDTLAAVAANPRLASDVVAESLGELAAEDPAAFANLAGRMIGALQYVAANLPPTVAVSLSYPSGVPITDQELRDVADLWNTAIAPRSALDDMEALRASPIQVKTLRDVHADIYNGVRKELFLQAGELHQSIPSQTKLSLDIMFGADGLGGLFATSEAARYITEARRKAIQSGKPAGPPRGEGRDTSATVEPAGVAAVRRGVTNKGTV